MSFRSVVGTIAGALFVLACTSAPISTPSIVGRYQCAGPGHTTDTVDVRSDGTITITQPSGQSGTGTWTLEGTIFTITGVGQRGRESFTVDGERILGAGELVCTKLS